MGNMKTQLCWPTPQGASRDPNFPEFIFGDITDPATGLLFNMQEQETSSVSLLVPSFSHMDFSLEGSQVMPVTPKILEGRVDLGDLASYVIPSFQDLVDLLLREGVVPAELIAEACGHRANIECSGESVSSSNIVDAQGNAVQAPQNTAITDEEVPMNHPEVTPAASQPAPTPPAAPAPPAPAPTPPSAPTPPEAPKAPAPTEDNFWVTVDGAVVLKAESEVRALKASGGLGSDKGMPEDQSMPWTDLDVLLPDVVDTPIPDTVEPTPPASVPSTPAAAPTTETKAGKATEDLSALTDAERERYALLAPRMSGNKDPLSVEEIDELMGIINRIDG